MCFSSWGGFWPECVSRHEVSAECWPSYWSVFLYGMTKPSVTQPPVKLTLTILPTFFFFFFFTAEVHTCCLPPSLPLLFLCFHSIVKPMSFLHRANGKQEEYILQLMLVIYILSPEGIYYLVVYCSKTHRTPQWRLTTVWESSKMQQNIWVTPDWCLFIQPHSLPHPFSLPPVGC